MKWVKAPEELVTLIESLMQPVDCEKRPMFGYPAYFIKKNLFSGLFQDKLFLRLSQEQVASLGKAFANLANLAPMPGRPMKDYWVIPEKLLKDGPKMARVVEDAATWCRSLPEKVKKPRKKASK